jgi:hypothetical protein
MELVGCFVSLQQNICGREEFSFKAEVLLYNHRKQFMARNSPRRAITEPDPVRESNTGHWANSLSPYRPIYLYSPNSTRVKATTSGTGSTHFTWPCRHLRDTPAATSRRLTWIPGTRN